MALQQTILIDRIEISENDTLQVRQRTDIYDDTNPSVVMASSYHRTSLTPGQDLTGQDPKVVAVANAVWTTKVINSFKSAEEKYLA